jgi:transcriptional regulator with XRE-family HTH domain
MIHDCNILFDGKDVRDMRERLGMSQKQLALYIGLGPVAGQRSVAYWETGGRRPPRPMQIALKIICEFGTPDRLEAARAKLEEIDVRGSGATPDEVREIIKMMRPPEAGDCRTSDPQS